MIDFEAAVSYLKGNKVRTVLTVAIIAVGIMAIVGIQTAITIMTESIAGSFSKMGTDLLSLEPMEGKPSIGVKQARSFVKQSEYFAQIASVYSIKSSIAQIKSGRAVTDPVITVISADEQYLGTQSSDVTAGRVLTSSDILRHTPVAMIGANVQRKLFRDEYASGDESEAGVGENILVCGRRFRVVGVIGRQGAMFGTGLDNSVIVPLENEKECQICFIPVEEMGSIQAGDEARQLMRQIRALGPSDESDFLVVRADTMQGKLEAIKSKLSVAAFLSGLITLLGSVVGLMNIMLVSVKERTREIGTRKALGARNSEIIRQFLTESVLIGQAGGVSGIVLGILSGNIVALLMDGRFTVPWNWLVISVILCFVVSLMSGIMPARRAAALNPIEALRDE